MWVRQSNITSGSHGPSLRYGDDVEKLYLINGIRGYQHYNERTDLGPRIGFILDRCQRGYTVEIWYDLLPWCSMMATLGFDQWTWIFKALPIPWQEIHLSTLESLMFDMLAFIYSLMSAIRDTTRNMLFGATMIRSRD